MSRVLDPFRFDSDCLLRLDESTPLDVIDYLREENRVLREQLGVRRLPLNDDQRLAAKAKPLGRTLLEEIGMIVTRTPCLPAIGA